MKKWLLLLGLAACGPELPVETRPDFSSDLPISGVSLEWETAFNEGDALFDLPFREADGLGPLFIRTSCGNCHRAAARGPGLVERVVQVDFDGRPTPGQPALPYGSVVRPYANSGATPLLAPMRDDVKVSRRAGIPVMGRGWLEAVADSELVRVAAEQALRTDGVSGRINYVKWMSEPNSDTRFHQHRLGDTVIGRFGLKARQPMLDDFAADALQGDMGLTSPLRTHEVPNAEGLADDRKPGVDMTMAQTNALADYVRLIAIPRRKAANENGRQKFEAVGCNACHVPSLRTRDDYPIEQLAGADAPIFTDLLLHDLGPTLSDGIVDGDASASEWRTAPLIGVRFLTAFLHDGRAASVDEAIRLHGAEGSEAKSSVESYAALAEDDRVALLEYVSSL
ncbi:MAG: hypothetical protein DI536_22525 [Archangium gephyra]|uniref:Cytochrome c domain-containing protein n=1 Tax=Archangium gephyra TaxID=48 RepID=A0A2W5T0U4_9BACT|nr:MAG: hypothetical protein DI536_22525 [Archangium gephyra]